MKKHYVIVEHRSSGQVKALQSQIRFLQKELSDLRVRHTQLESRFGYEVFLNAELIDLLREHGIPFRKLLSHEERIKEFGDK